MISSIVQDSRLCTVELLEDIPLADLTASSHLVTHLSVTSPSHLRDSAPTPVQRLGSHSWLKQWWGTVEGGLAFQWSWTIGQRALERQVKTLGQATEQLLSTSVGLRVLASTFSEECNLADGKGSARRAFAGSKVFDQT